MRRMQLALILALLLALLVVVGLWLAHSRDSASAPAASTVARDADARALPAIDERAPVAPADAEPAAVAPLAAPPSAVASTPARLVVHVTRARDHQPAADVGLLVMNTGGLYWYADVIAGRTDADGTWTLDPAPLGLLRVTEDRGDSQEARITAGQTTELSLEILEGRTVRGVVVDERGQPVADAGLWLFDNKWSPHARLVARADGAGHFALEDVRRQWLGARAAGHAPSDLVDADGLPADGEVSLRLRGPGGRVLGRVRDAAGQPLAGALVVVGPNFGWPEQAGGRSGPPAFLVRAASDGSFDVEDVPVGSTPVAAALEGWSPWTSTIEVREGETCRLDVVLPPGATLSGTVRGAKGEPVAGASIRAGKSDTVFDRVECSSDEAGRYALRSLPLGAQHVVAADREAGQDSHDLDVVAGQRFAWDPVLGTGLRFTGRVVDARGAPLADMLVFANHIPHDDVTGLAQTDEAGRFEIEHCEDRDYLLEVTSPRADVHPLVKRLRVRPGPDEFVLVVPDSERREGSITGRLTDDRGRPIGGVSVHAVGASKDDPESGDGPPGGGSVAPVDAGTGEFTLEQLQPGDFTLAVLKEDWYFVYFQVAGLQLGEHRDIGTLVAPRPAHVNVRLVLPEGIVAQDVDVQVEWTGVFGWVAQPCKSAGEVGSLEWRSGPLDPRLENVLCASGPLVAERRLNLQLAPGADSAVQLPLERGVHVELGFVLGAAPHHELAVSFTDASGALVARFRPHVSQAAGRPTATASVSVGLAPGHYELHVEHNGQEVHTESLDVPADATSLPSRVIQVP